MACTAQAYAFAAASRSPEGLAAHSSGSSAPLPLESAMEEEIAMKEDAYDVVVGGGAAGLSAALVLGRARRRVAVIDAGAPRNAPAAQMQGFLSRAGMPPADLLAEGGDEAALAGTGFSRTCCGLFADSDAHPITRGGPRR
jgi:hypothetical protein